MVGDNGWGRWPLLSRTWRRSPLPPPRRPRVSGWALAQGSTAFRLLLLGVAAAVLLLLTCRAAPPFLRLPWRAASPSTSFAVPSSVDGALDPSTAALEAAYPPQRFERPSSTFAHPLTVVVAYWRFTSKHSSAEYDAWLQHFLANCEAPMVLFTSASQYPTLAALRYGRLFEGASPEAFAPSTANAVEEVHLPLRPSRSLRRHFLTHWVLDFASPLDIPLMAQLRPAFESQLATDPERVRHSALLYATWSAKPWLVNHSAALNVFGSRYFAWMDAGQFRRLSRPLHRLPSAAQLAAAFEEAELPSSPPFPPHRAALHPHPSSAPVASRHHKALLVAVHPYTRDFCRPLDPSSSHPPHLLLDQHAGQSFVVTAQSARWYAAVYYDTAWQWVSRGWLIGKDQTLMNALVQAYKGSFLILGAFRVEGEEACWTGRGWDAHWSFLASFLAAEEERLPGCGAEFYDAGRMVREAQDIPCEAGHADEWTSRPSNSSHDGTVARPSQPT